MAKKQCKICHATEPLDTFGRCRGCREAKAASDMGISYGALKGRLFERYGDRPTNQAEGLKSCPCCGKNFLQSNGRQKYCSNHCAQLTAARRYYARHHGKGPK